LFYFNNYINLNAIVMKFLFNKIDNSPLIVFRIIFGIVLTAEAWGSIFTGWIQRTYIDPHVHFSPIGLEWLQPFEGNGMFYFYAIMGLFGLGVLLGYFYKISIIVYTLLWTYCYLTHKISYNNHYYLMILLCLIMCFLPAHKYASIDVKQNRVKKQYFMSNWCKLILIFQISCVYIFGGIAKIYPDWLDGTFTKIMLASKSSFPVIGSYFTKSYFYMTIAYGGILFDLFVIPLLCFKKTRIFGFLISILFHSFNSIVFQVGVFPYLSMSFALFFFSDSKIQQLFLPKKKYFTATKTNNTSQKTIALLSFYCFLQLFLPLRQYFIQGNTFWTEEAHKMSWRMMLRSSSGYTYFKIKNSDTQKTQEHYPNNLSNSQIGLLNTKPDVIWQYAQLLKKQENEKGNSVEVYAISHKSLNGRPRQEFIDPTVDLANTSWNYFSHQPWIRSFKGWE